MRADSIFQFVRFSFEENMIFNLIINILLWFRVPSVCGCVCMLDSIGATFSERLKMKLFFMPNTIGISRGSHQLNWISFAPLRQ